MEELGCHNREQIDEVAGGDNVLIFSKNGILLYCNLELFKLADLAFKAKKLSRRGVHTLKLLHIVSFIICLSCSSIKI